MKKLLYISLISLSFILPSKVFAFTGTLSLECDTLTKKVGETISCTLYGNTDGSVSAVEGNLVYGADVTLSNVTVPTIWQGNYENKSLLLYTDTNKTGKFELLKFNVSSNNAGEKTLTFSNVYFSDDAFTRHSVLNPNYVLTFITEEEQNQNDEQTSAVVVDGNNSENKEEKPSETNPDSGSFIPLTLIIVLSSLSVLIFIKTKNKKIFKL